MKSQGLSYIQYFIIGYNIFTLSTSEVRFFPSKSGCMLCVMIWLSHSDFSSTPVRLKLHTFGLNRISLTHVGPSEVYWELCGLSLRYPWSSYVRLRVPILPYGLSNFGMHWGLTSLSVDYSLDTNVVISFFLSYQGLLLGASWVLRGLFWCLEVALVYFGCPWGTISGLSGLLVYQ